MDPAENSTLQNILNAACGEFLEKGYKNASLRSISGKAGVTTGALYGYFKNKEDLFGALVKKHYQHILDLYLEILSDFNQLSPQQQQTDMISCTLRGAARMVDYIYQYKDAFKLILCCSEGTEYSSLVHDMAQLDVSATHRFGNTLEDTGHSLKSVNANLEHMLTSGMFSTFFELIIHDIPREEAEEYVKQLIAFYAAGWAEIMGL